LGHASIATTHEYVEIDLDMKRKTLQSCEKLLPNRIGTTTKNAKHRRPNNASNTPNASGYKKAVPQDAGYTGWQADARPERDVRTSDFHHGEVRLSKQIQGHIIPESFIHGTTKQRVKCFAKEFETGAVDQCYIFEAGGFYMVRFDLYDRRSFPYIFNPSTLTSTNKKELTHVNRTCH
jgi:hypothetical protein